MPAAPDDPTRDLLDEVEERWESSWSQFVSRCESKLRILVHFKLRGADARSVEPDDVVQEVWSEAMRRFETFEYRGPGSFYAWLVGIMRNKIHHASRASGDPVVAGAESRLPSNPAAASGPRGLLEAIEQTQTSVSSRIANAELEERVKLILERLPDRLREVLVLRIYEARSGRETASALGVHESVVSVRMQQAIEACSRLMKSAS